MHPGDLIYVSMRPPYAPGAGPRQQNVPVSLRSQVSSTPGDVRMALVMVRTGENGAPSVRLVQDFGCPDDPDAPLAALAPSKLAAPATATPPPKRGRGRPPGSKTRKKEEVDSRSLAPCVGDLQQDAAG
jgi:hypothetical protein